jgi:hypothetical protein
LIERDVDKQRRPARLKAAPMAAAVDWLEEFKQFWSSSFDRLDGLLEELKRAEDVFKSATQAKRLTSKKAK